jgi:hypothetical protein
VPDQLDISNVSKNTMPITQDPCHTRIRCIGVASSRGSTEISERFAPARGWGGSGLAQHVFRSPARIPAAETSRTGLRGRAAKRKTLYVIERRGQREVDRGSRKGFGVSRRSNTSDEMIPSHWHSIREIIMSAQIAACVRAEASPARARRPRQPAGTQAEDCLRFGGSARTVVKLRGVSARSSADQSS